MGWKVIMITRRINIREVWQQVGESVERFPSPMDNIFLHPLKSLESAREREDRDEDVKGYTANVDELPVKRLLRFRLPLHV